MISLNAGNLWTDSYLDKVLELNDLHKNDGIQVKSLFGSIVGMTPTARSSDRLPAVDRHFAAAYIKRAQSSGIAIRYTLNQSCIGAIQDFKSSWDSDLKSAVAILHDMEVHEWTITSPLLITLLHELFPNDFIEVSTIAEVSTPTDAQRWKDLGAGGVNVSTNINRCFPLLHDINRVLKASVLANEACLYRCPYRRDCYNLSSHDSWRGRKFFDWYPFRWCNEQRIRNPEEWLKSRMVMPQWMRIYQKRAGIEWFKIAYRTHPESVAVPILEAYMSQNFTGNYCAMWPTIARLGDTSEPTKTTYISAKALDDTGFLDWWDSEEDECSGTRCGLECVYCHTAYDKAKEAGQ